MTTLKGVVLGHEKLLKQSMWDAEFVMVVKQRGCCVKRVMLSSLIIGLSLLEKVVHVGKKWIVRVGWRKSVEPFIWNQKYVDSANDGDGGR